MTADKPNNDILKKISPTRVIIAVLIGVGFTVYLFLTEYSVKDLRYILDASWGGIVAALVVLVIRDFGYIYRLRHLSEKRLNWKSSTYSILLWEFASAVTPSAVGGTVIAVFILSREGLSVGKAVAYVVVTAVFDNLFFITAGAIVYVAYGDALFVGLPDILKIVFLISYLLIMAYTIFMSYGVFLRPRAIKWTLLKITSIRILRRYRYSAAQQGNEIIMASKEMSGKPPIYWIKGIISTIFVWSARYLVINALIESFTDLSFTDHLFTFSENIILWIVMLFSITPGAAGQAEVAFDAVFNKFVGNMGGITIIMWRAITYYLYLMVGLILLPRWLRRTVIIAKKKFIKQMLSGDPT